LTLQIQTVKRPAASKESEGYEIRSIQQVI